MEKLKEAYEEAEIKIVLFEFSDIVTLSIEHEEDEEEQGKTPTDGNDGNWESDGWT